VEVIPLGGIDGDLAPDLGVADADLVTIDG
jgi:hypothetical protein